MEVIIIVLILGILSVVQFLRHRVGGNYCQALYGKAAASIVFVLAAIMINSFYSVGSPVFGQFIVIGLIFGLLGDIALDLRYLDSKHERAHTKFGMLFFGLGHIFYITALLLYESAWMERASQLFLPLFLACVFGWVTIKLEGVMGLRYGCYKGASFLYGILLFAFTFVSGWLAITSNFERKLCVIFVGSVFFLLSDLILTKIYFSKSADQCTPKNVVINHILYYIAQYTIALNLL